ncbi:MAG: ATP-binding protein [Syntrophales bacterium]|jgi:PAS domain S-box-containing protein|nr:ATP-binding protein [Syntrophales bacterium]
MLGLRHKLSLGFGGLLLIIMIIGIQSILQFKNLGQSIDVILKENYRSVIACQEMKEALERMDSGILFTFLGYSEEGTRLIRKNEATFVQALDVELHNITLLGESEKAVAVKTLYASYVQVLHRIENQSLPPEIRRSLYFEELLPLFQQIKNEADAILQMNQNNMHEANDLARRQAAGAQRHMYIFLFFGAVIAVAFMVFTGKWILHPINRLIHSSEAIRDGNLDLVVKAESRDEIGRLSEAFNDMALSLRAFRRSDQAKLARTREAAQETFSRLPDAVAIVDPEGRVEISTASAKNLFGLRTGLFVRDASVDHLNRLFHSVINQDHQQYREEEKLFQLFTNGEERYFHADAAPRIDRDGRLTGVILILKDVTEQRHVEELKSGLISTVSHQLKTPLTSIRMAIHLLLEEKVGPLTEKQLELLLAAQEESDLLHRILSKLLDIRRIESGRSQMIFQTLSPHALIMEAVEAFRRSAQEGGVELTTAIPDNLPLVNGDTIQIGTVFSNLLSNALSYTAPGGRISVKAEMEGQMVHFFVTDTGSGIPRQFIDRIFEQFFRVPDQKSETGTGLGLAIAKEIVEAHGGAISVESREGEGTTFSFTLKKAEQSSAGA